MTTATLVRPKTNQEVLGSEGIVLNHLSSEARSQLDSLGFDEIQTLIDLKRRFAGELAIDPTMYTGSDAY